VTPAGRSGMLICVNEAATPGDPCSFPMAIRHPCSVSCVWCSSHRKLGAIFCKVFMTIGIFCGLRWVSNRE